MLHSNTTADDFAEMLDNSHLQFCSCSTALKLLSIKHLKFLNKLMLDKVSKLTLEQVTY